MTTSVREIYLQSAHRLETDDLSGYNAGNNPIDTPAQTNRLAQKFKELGALYNLVVKELEGVEQEEVRKVHAQVSFLFVPMNEQSATYLEMKQVHYLRIALEQKLEKKLVAEQFAKLTYPQMRTAFKLLNATFGRPTGKTNADGMIHIAKNPLNLLAPAKGVKDTPRIIDVLLQESTEKKLENLQQSIAISNAKAAERKKVVDDTFHSGPVTNAKAESLAASSIAAESDTMALFTATYRDTKAAFATSSSASHGKINSAKLMAFHKASTTSTNDAGRSCFDILCQEDLVLMKNNEEIRWLFPLKEDVDDPSFFTNFVANQWCIGNLKQAFSHMLKIYGFELDEKAIRSVKPKKGTSFLWLHSQYKHWQDHIERILKCLVAMNMHVHAHHFLLALEDVAKNEGKNDIATSTLKTWQKAVPAVAPLTSPIDSAKLLEFYTSPTGLYPKMNRTRDEMLKLSNLLNVPEEEMQWLFPLPQDVADFPSFVNQLKAKGGATNLRNTYDRFLNAYGLEFLKEEEKRVVLRKQGAPMSCWEVRNAPHHKNIERILKCFTTMGFAEGAKAFLIMLEDIAKKEGKGAISQATLEAWRKAVS